MGLNFELPSFVKPQEYPALDNMGLTLDRLFNSYLKAQSAGQESDIRRLQIAEAREEATARQTRDIVNFGAPLSSYSQEQRTGAAQYINNPEATGAAPLYRNDSPAQVAGGGISQPIDINTYPPALLAGLSQMKQRSQMGIQKEQLGLKETEADIQLKESRTGLNKTLSAGGGSKGSMSAEEVNRLTGVDLFPEGSTVTAAQQRMANQLITTLKVPEGAKGQLIAIKDARGFIDQLRSKYNALAEKGKVGLLAGYTSVPISKITKGAIDPDIYSYLTFKEGLVGRLKGVAGEVGRITDQDTARLLKITGDAGTDPRAAEMNFKEAMDLLDIGEKNIKEQYPVGIERLKMGGKLTGKQGDVGSDGNEITKQVKTKSGIRDAIYSNTGKFLRWGQ